LHQVGDLFELNVKLRCQKVNGNMCTPPSAFMAWNGQIYIYVLCLSFHVVILRS